jgi:hypothetical protein
MSADERAAMLAGLGDGDVPAFLLDEKVDFRMELDVWKDQAPHLKRMNALQKPDRYTFAIYCVHMADWIRATLDIRKNGATYKARSTITKDVLHKLNPMVRVRNDAYPWATRAWDVAAATPGNWFDAAWPTRSSRSGRPGSAIRKAAGPASLSSWRSGRKSSSGCWSAGKTLKAFAISGA